MRFRKSAHSIYRTEYHIVWTPRYRRRILVKGVKEYLERLFFTIEDIEDDIEVKKVNVQIDHVHLVIVIPPRTSVARVVQFLKSQTAKKLKERFTFLKKVIKKSGIWSRGYFVSTVGASEKIILQYIEYQEKEDKGQLELDFRS